MNYTKGEWKVVKTGSFKSAHWAVQTQNGIIAATSLTNAQLISAAPDMYEALKLAIEKLNNEGRAYERTIWVCEEALAKAEGKEK